MMSKIQAFFLSCLIYFCILFAFFVFLNNAKKEIKNIQYGNFEISIITQDFSTNSNAKKATEDKKQLDSQISTNTNNIQEEKKEQIQNKNNDVSSLFDSLNTNKPVVQNKNVENNIAKKTVDVSKVSSILNSIKSNKDSNQEKTSTKIKGVYDEYLSAINIYLTSIWNLILANSPLIDDKNSIKLNYYIDEEGYISIEDINKTSDDIFYQCVREFIKKINNDKKNLGIPPLSKPYKGIIRLSKKLVVKEIL